MNDTLIKLFSTGVSDEERSSTLARVFSYSVLKDALHEVEDAEIILNVAKCLMCGEIIESTNVHEHISCKCGNIFVDGGTAYLRRGYHTDEGTGWIDLSVKQDKYS